MRISANIGFLWNHLPLMERIRRAAASRFDAVECHFPYTDDPRAIAQLLDDCEMPLLSLNTGHGRNGSDDFGVAAQPDRVEEARELIEQAVDFATASGCRMISVLAGRAHRATACEATYRENLAFAARHAAAHG